MYDLLIRKTHCHSITLNVYLKSCKFYVSLCQEHPIHKITALLRYDGMKETKHKIFTF